MTLITKETRLAIPRGSGCLSFRNFGLRLSGGPSAFSYALEELSVHPLYFDSSNKIISDRGFGRLQRWMKDGSIEGLIVNYIILEHELRLL